MARGDRPDMQYSQPRDALEQRVPLSINIARKSTTTESNNTVNREDDQARQQQNQSPVRITLSTKNLAELESEINTENNRHHRDESNNNDDDGNCDDHDEYSNQEYIDKDEFCMQYM